MLINDALAAATRTVPRAVLGIALAALAPVVITRVRGGTDVSGALVAASLFAGAGVGYVVDDAAARTLASSPTPLAARRVLRGAITTALLVGAWLGAWTVGATSPGPGPAVAPLAAYATASAAIAIAVASRLEPDGAASPGLSAAGTSVVVVLLVGLLSVRYRALPSLTGEHVARWWWIAAVGAVAGAYGSRDPATGGLKLRRRSG